MFKFAFMLFLSFLNLASPGKLSSYQIIREDVTVEEQREVLDECGIYRISFIDNQYYLETMTHEWTRPLPVIDNYKILIVDNNCLIFYYQEGYLLLLEYSPSGNKITDKRIIDNKIHAVFDINFQGDFYLVGGVSEYHNDYFLNARRTDLEKTDAFILKLNRQYELKKVSIFGGVLNEEFVRMHISEDCLYLAGKKDPLTGGDFGNGGSLENTNFLVKMDFDFNLIQYLVLSDNSNILDLCLYKEYLYFMSEINIYKINEEFEIITKRAHRTKAIFSCLTFFNCLLIAFENKIELVIICNLEPVALLDVEITKETKIRKFDHILYLSGEKTFYLDIAYLEDFKILNKFYPEVETKKEVSTIFGKAEYLRETGETIFNPLVFGVYQRDFVFLNKYGVEFVVTRFTEVLEEVNVSNNLIYPLGYSLKFTGIALLNGQSIINNYKIAEAGEYNLELSGKDGSKKNYFFIVKDDQIKFQDLSIKNWDFDVKPDQSFTIELTYQGFIENQIESVIINNEANTNLLIDHQNNRISINMYASNSPGIYYYYLEGINYYVQEDLRRIPVEQVVVVNVLKQPIIVDLEQVEPLKFNATSTDLMQTARYFEVRASTNNEEIIEIYSIASHNINLFDLEATKEYQVTISIVYDLGNTNYLRLDLLEMEVIGSDYLNLGEIEVTQRSESIDAFNLNLKKDSKIKKVSIDNLVFYEKAEEDYHLIIGIAFVLMIAIAIITNSLKNYFSKKKIYR